MNTQIETIPSSLELTINEALAILSKSPHFWSLTSTGRMQLAAEYVASFQEASSIPTIKEQIH